MITVSNEGICVEFWRKNNQPWFSYFQIVCKYQKYFKTYPLNIIFDDFSIQLLGYRTEFSCLYLPQGHNFISTVCVAMKYRWICIFFILSESPSLMSISLHVLQTFRTSNFGKKKVSSKKSPSYGNTIYATT